MTQWEDKWFRVVVKVARGLSVEDLGLAGGGRRAIAYLNVLSWDEAESVMDATLHQYDATADEVISIPLSFDFLAGTPADCSLLTELGGEVPFDLIVRLKGRLVKGVLRRARLTTLRENSALQSANPGPLSGSAVPQVRVTGRMVPESRVPPRFLEQ
jgi:hypothetical protein